MSGDDRGLLADRAAEFRMAGFTVIRRPAEPAIISDWKTAREELADREVKLRGRSMRPNAVRNVMEYRPLELIDFLQSTDLVALLELIVGPRVQLDSSVLAGDPGIAGIPPDHVVEWHKDRFHYQPRGYLFPWSVVSLTYLQDMDDTSGALHVLPRSHVERFELADPTGRLPQARRVAVGAGDTVVLHHNLVHSGSRTADPKRERQFLGLAFNLSGMRQEDNFDGPVCQMLKERAVDVGDRRLLRLLGSDPSFNERWNSGGLRDEAAQWAEWAAQDGASVLGSTTS